jgi:hypothetical protein
MAVRINIKELTERVFGLDQIGRFRRPIIGDIEIEEFEAIGLLGQPVQSIITFGAVSFNGQDFEPITFLAPIITCNQVHQVSRTALIGRRSSVKEHISIDDYQISIAGVIYGVDENGNPSKNLPIDDMTAVREYFQTPIAKPVDNKFLNALGIYEVVLEEFSPFIIPGNQGQLGIELRLISDEPIELQEELSE